MPGTIVFHLQIREELIVLGEVFWRFLQTTDAKSFWRRRVIAPFRGVGIAKEMDELAVLHTVSPLIYVSHDLIPHRREDVCRQPISTDSNQTVTGLQMNIIARMQSLTAVGRDVSAQMALIGRLVG